MNLDWPEVPLTMLAALERGTEPGSDSYCSPSQGVRFLRVGDISGKTDSPIYTRSTNISLVEENDILLALDGSPGYVATGFQGAISSGIRKVTPLDESILDREWLLYALQSTHVQSVIQRHTKGVTILHASSAINFITLFLPTLIEQKRLATILQHAASLRRQRRGANELARRLLPALFYEIFGASNQWKETERLEKCVDFIGGGTPSRKVGKYYTGEIPWATSKDIKARYLDDAQEHITEEAIQNSATNRVPAESILLVVKSKILAHTLPMAIITRPFCFGQDLKALVCKNGNHPEFIVASLLAQSGSILNSARGVNTEGLTLEILRKISIPAVAPEQQAQFVQMVREYDSVEKKQADSDKQTNNLFVSLLFRAFVGELTETWRNQHEAELGPAIEKRDEWLKARGVQRSVLTSTVVEQPVITENIILARLSIDQQRVSTLAQNHPAPYFTLQTLWDAQEEGARLDRDVIERGLSMLEALGVILKVSVPVSPTGEAFYQNVYRLAGSQAIEEELRALKDRFPNIRL